MNRKPGDDLLKRRVEEELAWDSRVAGSRPEVAVHNGIVTISGDVESYAARFAIQEAAHRVTGVRDVVNDVVTRLPEARLRGDTEIAGFVRTTLQWDAFVPDDQITTTVSGGWVTLEGQVDTWHQRQEAERAIRRIAGIAGVFNNLRVQPVSVKPSVIERSIEQALERRADREADRIGIAVHGDLVVLSGAVRSWGEKRAVLGTVEHTPGVSAVEDRLTIESGG